MPTYLILVELSQSFPQEAPVLTFQSIYHESKDKPYTEIHDGYPYSPRWSSTEMVSRIKWVFKQYFSPPLYI